MLSKNWNAAIIKITVQLYKLLPIAIKAKFYSMMGED
jgi:hypothetical protein